MNKSQPNHNDQLPEGLERLRAKGDGFRRPDGDYFVSLADKVLSEVATPPVQNKRGRIRRLTPLVLGIAASLLLLLWWQPWSPPASGGVEVVAQTNWEASLEALDDEDILAYIQDNIHDFELDVLTTEN